MCPNAPVISHLCFADDTLILYGVNLPQAMVVKAVLKSYESVSSQCVNYSKTDILFSKGVDEDRRHVITLALDIRELTFENSYRTTSI